MILYISTTSCYLSSCIYFQFMRCFLSSNLFNKFATTELHSSICCFFFLQMLMASIFQSSNNNVISVIFVLILLLWILLFSGLNWLHERNSICNLKKPLVDKCGYVTIFSFIYFWMALSWIKYDIFIHI